MNKTNLNAFYKVADIAATKWFQNKCFYYNMPTWNDAAARRKTDSKAYTFRRPSFSHPTGYFALLRYIADKDNGATRRELCEAFNLKCISFTVDLTLCYAGLVKLDNKHTHKFTVTPFGRAYLALAELARPELEAS